MQKNPKNGQKTRLTGILRENLPQKTSKIEKIDFFA